MLLIFSTWVFAYALGSIPFGVLFARTQNIDLRAHGSKNIGATNVARLIGKKAGALTLLGDMLKGWLGVAIVSLVSNDPFTVAGAGIMVFLGHLFSLFLKFKGGRGVATGLGVHLYIMPIQTLGAVAVFFFTLLVSKYISLSSIIASIALPIFGIFFDTPMFYKYMSLGIAILIVSKHYENICRIATGTEPRFLKK
ncbi:MAG TPA: glycerol-3-phosphate 1-O-acyltransferase PlsY [Nitrospinaceae bacterium]|jgi:glycerol-3-phosphate acyltransferase PlsY|nr:glycerol-3-phosphate 1-O-acyltransferase PlsY [Nitrospinaceae bacterium]